MKYLKYTLLVLLIAFVAYFSYAILFPSSPLDKVVYKSENSSSSYEVEYSRPYKKGRLIFGDSDKALVPYGEYWRTGANAATTFSTSEDIIFGEDSLKAGKYSLYTIPGENTWTVAFNSDSERWLAVGEADPDKDVLRVSIGSIKNTETVEQFTIDFSDSLNTYMNLKWDKTLISIPLK
jgi:hypothetical protein